MAPILTAASYDLNHICSTPDPGDPVLTAQDLVYAMNPADFVNSGAAWARIQQWFVHMMWPTWCDCANGTIPPKPTTAPLPSGNVNPGLPSAPVQAPCWDVTNSNSATGNATTDLFYDVTTRWLPGPLIHGFPGGDGQVDTASLVTPGTTQIHYSSVSKLGPDASNTCVVRLNLFDANKALIGTSGNILCRDNLTLQGNAPIGAAVYWALWGNIPFRATTFSNNMELSYACGEQPGVLSTPCCPPDSSLDQRLTSIIQMIQQLANAQLVGNVDLVDGTRHSGLTGNGTVTLVASCAAVRLEVKNLPPEWPHNPGSPNYYFSLGFITSIAIGTPLKGWRLVYQSQTFPLVSYADQVGYTLPPGLTVDLVEQLASP